MMITQGELTTTKTNGLCKKCQKEIGDEVIIDNRTIKLYKRSYCLNCYQYTKKGDNKQTFTCKTCGTQIPPYFIDDSGRKYYTDYRKRKNCFQCHPVERVITDFDDRVKENYPKYGIVWCMNEYNLSEKQVLSIKRRHHLKRSKEAISLIARNRIILKDEKDHKVNHKQFINIDNPIPAYLLGLLWTDGHINKRTNVVSFGTTYPDSEYFIEQFLKTGKWGTSRSKGTKIGYKDQVSIYTCNRFLKEFLKSHNYIDKEMGFSSIYDHIPAEYRNYFLLGCFDGDGCFHINKEKSRYRATICSSYNQDWTCLTNFLKLNGINHYIYKRESRHGKSSTVTINGKIRTKMLGEILYSMYLENNIGLKRKYDKYLQIKEQCYKNCHEKIVNESVTDTKIIFST